MHSSQETQSTAPLSRQRRISHRSFANLLVSIAIACATLIIVVAVNAKTTAKALMNLPSPNLIAISAGGGWWIDGYLGYYVGVDGHTCSLSGEGRVKCWGNNNNNLYGGGIRTVPEDVAGLDSGVTAIAAGMDATCAVVNGGRVKCWGAAFSIFSDYGNPACAGGVWCFTPVDVNITNAVSLVAGNMFACALTNVGGLECWGSGSWGLGNGGLNSGVGAVSARQDHMCALLNTGGVKCWGGIYSNGVTDVPIDISGLGTNVVSLASGGWHDCALTASGGVTCWGRNDHGQLGNGTITNSNYRAVDVSGLSSGVIAIAAGPRHTCAITSHGGVKCWGANESGQLGDGTTIESHSPVTVSGIVSGATAVAVGGYEVTQNFVTKRTSYSCALVNDSAMCWGANSHGELGDGSTLERHSPVAVQWYITATAASIITGSETTFTSTVDNTVYTLPSGVFTDTAVMTHAVPFREDVPPALERVNIGHAFETTAIYSDTGEPAAPMLPYTVTIQYTDHERQTAIESTLALYRWEGNQWWKEPGNVVDPISHTVTAAPDHLGLWAVLGDTYRVQLPLIGQSYQPSEGPPPLTFDPNNDTQPALSPDGQTMMFLSDRAGQTDIFSASATGGPATNLTHTSVAQEDTPVYSPDGTKIAFASDRSGDWDIYLMDVDGTNVQRAIGYTGTDELQPAFTPDGDSLLFSSNLISGNWDIYSATLGIETAVWMRLTIDPASDRFPSISADGTTIAFRSERDGNSEIYVMDADGSHQRRVTNDPAFDGYPSITPDGSGIVFASSRTGTSQVYGVNLGGTGLITWTTHASWEADHPRLSSDGHRLVYAARSVSGTFDIFTRPFATPLYKAAERGALNMTGRCDWEAGTLAYGLTQAWRATGDDHYLMWLQNWINACISVQPTNDHVNDGLLGYAALIAYETQGRPEQLAYAQQVANYFVYTATRTADGTLAHESDMVWDDTLLSTVPFMVEMSKVSGNTAYLEEAITQTIKHAQHLQDLSSGLYRHAWDESSNAYWPAYWARGNSWMLLADGELLASMPITHPQRAAIVILLQKQAAGLKPLPAADGRWHTVVNRPDFYLESSGSALIGFALRRAVQAGWLDAGQYDSVARLALLGVWRKALSDGTLSEVSAPTGPMLTEIEYNAIPYNSMQLYGQGALLLLASPLQP